MGFEHLMELWVSLFIAGEMDQMAFKDLFQLKQLYDLAYYLVTLFQYSLYSVYRVTVFET